MNELKFSVESYIAILQEIQNCEIKIRKINGKYVVAVSGEISVVSEECDTVQSAMHDALQFFPTFPTEKIMTINYMPFSFWKKFITEFPAYHLTSLEYAEDDLYFSDITNNNEIYRESIPKMEEVIAVLEKYYKPDYTDVKEFVTTETYNFGMDSCDILTVPKGVKYKSVFSDDDGDNYIEVYDV